MERGPDSSRKKQPQLRRRSLLLKTKTESGDDYVSVCLCVCVCISRGLCHKRISERKNGSTKRINIYIQTKLVRVYELCFSWSKKKMRR